MVAKSLYHSLISSMICFEENLYKLDSRGRARHCILFLCNFVDFVVSHIFEQTSCFAIFSEVNTNLCWCSKFIHGALGPLADLEKGPPKYLRGTHLFYVI